MLTCLAFCKKPAPDIHFTLEEVEVSESMMAKFYSASNNIRQEKDSVVAIAMLLNRECPECLDEEKYYLASTIVTGSKTMNVSWKKYLFSMNQFSGFKDKRLIFDPKQPNHINNLKAAKKAWKNPKKVMFYASEIDNPIHFNQVKRNGERPEGFYHFFSFKL